MDAINAFIEALAGSIDLTEKQLRWLQVAIAVILGSGFIGFLYSRWKAKRDFEARIFLDQIVFGLNILHWSADGRTCSLLLRTFSEDNASSVLDNKILEERLAAAAAAATDDPIITLPNQRDQDLLVTKVKNVISSRYAREFMSQMFGQKMETETVHFVVTCEKYGGIRATKVRVLFFREKDLMRFLQPTFVEQLCVREKHHADRVRTMSFIAHRFLNGFKGHGTVEIPIN